MGGVWRGGEGDPAEGADRLEAALHSAPPQAEVGEYNFTTMLWGGGEGEGGHYQPYQALPVVYGYCRKDAGAEKCRVKTTFGSNQLVELKGPNRESSNIRWQMAKDSW